MRLLIQRSLESNVTVDSKITGKINFGLVVLVGFTHTDTLKEIEYLAKKLVNLRIFDDENHIMNKSVIDVQGSILSISQFTLYADCKKGNRPSYGNAMNGNEAIKLYEQFNEELKKYNIKVETGIFGAEMFVQIQNDGPVTIWLESE